MTELLSHICFPSSAPLNRLLLLLAKIVLLSLAKSETILYLKRLAAMDAAIMPAGIVSVVRTLPSALPAPHPGKSSAPSAKNIIPVVLISSRKPVPCWTDLLMSATAAKKLRCTLEKRFYHAASAHKEYRDILSESRSGLSYSEEEIKRLDDIVSPLIFRGQSRNHICTCNRDSLMVSESTLYRLIDYNVFRARNIDLPRKVHYSRRRKAKVLKVDKAYRICLSHRWTPWKDEREVRSS